MGSDRPPAAGHRQATRGQAARRSLPVTLDLSQADLREYAGLLSGDWVIVTGTAPLGENRVIATSVQRVER